MKTACKLNPPNTDTIIPPSAGRWGEAEDLAGAAVFLASNASDYLQGHILTVDGGWMAR